MAFLVLAPLSITSCPLGTTDKRMALYSLIHLSTLPSQVYEKMHKMPPQHSLPQANQPQLSQPVLIWQLNQVLDYLSVPLAGLTESLDVQKWEWATEGHLWSPHTGTWHADVQVSCRGSKACRSLSACCWEQIRPREKAEATTFSQGKMCTCSKVHAA